jgi:hypothetical protein
MNHFFARDFPSPIGRALAGLAIPTCKPFMAATSRYKLKLPDYP